jgi:2',3'-cyclic-nucleotide 2'-phosphodiesterase (5'-nucleotidase family)
MDLPTSDYAEVQFVRVIDAAATIAQSAFFLKLNGKWRVDPNTGHIDQRDAAKVEGEVETQLRSQLTGSQGTSTDECSAIQGVVLDPTNNLLSSKILNASVQIVPFGYSEMINVNIGFVNPLLS